MNLTDLFTLASLSASINKLPYKPTKLGDSGVFIERGIQSTTVVIDEQQGRLVLVPNLSRNDDPVPQTRNARTRRTFQTTHLAAQGVIYPQELQNLAPFGEDTVDSQQSRIINDRLMALKANLDITREWQRVGAIKGQILDSDGSILVDLFNEFGITKKSLSAGLVASTDVRKTIMTGKRFAEKSLGGAVVTDWKCYCASDFWDAFVSNASVQKAFANYQEAGDRLGGDQRNSGFVFGGVTFYEYNATVSGQQFIPDGTAKMFPVADGIFQMFNAPANYNETVNTLGLPYYAKAEARELGKGWKIEAQSNPLAVCMYPETLVEFTLA